MNDLQLTDNIDSYAFLWQEEVKEMAPTLSVHGDNIKVTEVLKDGDTLTFLIVSQKVRKVHFIVL